MSKATPKAHGRGTPTSSAPQRDKSTRRSRGRTRGVQAVVVACAVAILAVVGVIAFTGNGAGSSNSISTRAFSLPALDGTGRVALTQFKGKPTVVNFFASWCSVCDQELPGFRTEAQALQGRVNFVGIDSLETGDKNYMPQRHHLVGVFTALARDVGGSHDSGLHDALGGGNKMPLTAFYNAEGHLVHVEHGGLSPASTLAAEITRYLNVAAPA